MWGLAVGRATLDLIHETALELCQMERSARSTTKYHVFSGAKWCLPDIHTYIRYMTYAMGPAARKVVVLVCCHTTPRPGCRMGVESGRDSHAGMDSRWVSRPPERQGIPASLLGWNDGRTLAPPACRSTGGVSQSAVSAALKGIDEQRVPMAH